MATAGCHCCASGRFLPGWGFPAVGSQPASCSLSEVSQSHCFPRLVRVSTFSFGSPWHGRHARAARRAIPWCPGSARRQCLQASATQVWVRASDGGVASLPGRHSAERSPDKGACQPRPLFDGGRAVERRGPHGSGWIALQAALMFVHCLMDPREGLASPREGRGPTADLSALAELTRKGRTTLLCFPVCNLWRVGERACQPRPRFPGTAVVAAAALPGCRNFCAKSPEQNRTACATERTAGSLLSGVPPSAWLRTFPVNSTCLRVSVPACIILGAQPPWRFPTSAFRLA